MSAAADESDWRTLPSVRLGPDRTVDGIAASTSSRFPYQEEAVARLAAWYASPERAGVLCLPTGAGKTRTAVDFIVEHVLDREVRVLWLTHRAELMDQAIATFAARGHLAKRDFRVGRFGPKGKSRVADIVHVVVGSIAALVRADNLDQLWRRQGGFDLVVVDECHHAPARTWRALIEDVVGRRDDVKLLGLSATPTRNARRQAATLWKLFGDVLYEAPALDLIRGRYLARPELIPVRTERSYTATVEEARWYTEFDELPESLVNRIAGDETRNALAAQTFIDSPGRWGKTLMFAARRVQADSLVGRLRESGVRVCSVDGTMSRDARSEALSTFRSGRCDVLVNVQILTEGTDLPDVATVFLARPTRSQVLFQQMVGRGMRGPLVGGSAECRVVVLQDSIEGLVEKKLTHSYGWEAQEFARLGLTDAIDTGRADDDEGAAESASAVDEAEEDVGREEAITGFAEEVRELLHGAGIRATKSETTLAGWWELIPMTPAPLPRRYVMPYFHGDEGLRVWVEELASAIPRGAVTAPPPTPRWVTGALAAAFWYRARTLPAAPVLREIDAISNDLAGELARACVAWVHEPEFIAERREHEKRVRARVAAAERGELRERSRASRSVPNIGGDRPRRAGFSQELVAAWGEAELVFGRDWVLARASALGTREANKELEEAVRRRLRDRRR